MAIGSRSFGEYELLYYNLDVGTCIQYSPNVLFDV